MTETKRTHTHSHTGERSRKREAGAFLYTVDLFLQERSFDRARTFGGKESCWTWRLYVNPGSCECEPETIVCEHTYLSVSARVQG